MIGVKKNRFHLKTLGGGASERIFSSDISDIGKVREPDACLARVDEHLPCGIQGAAS